MTTPRCLAYTITSAMALIIVFSTLPLLSNIFAVNECQMTVMWSPPNFWPFPMDHPRYYVYHYTEGLVTSPPLNTEPDEIPVVFIPGSGGSRNQVRSLASVMKKKKDLKKPPYTYRFFTMDFREEKTILNGKMLAAQTAFVVDTIVELRNRYHNRTMIVYGHSLGGVVAMGLVTDPRFNASWVDMFILKSAPLERSPLLLDNRARNYYLRMQKAWKKRELDNVAVLSYSGGLKDLLVSDSLTRYGYIAAVPIWTIENVPDYGTDHLCMLWCNQVVAHASRLLERYAEKRMSMTPRTILRSFLESEVARRDNKVTVRSLASDVMQVGDRRTFRTPENQFVSGVYVKNHQIVQVKTHGKCVKSVTQIRNNNFRNTRLNNGTMVTTTIYRNERDSLVTLVFEVEKNCEFRVETSSWFSATCGIFLDLLVSETMLVLCVAYIYWAFHITNNEAEWLDHILVITSMSTIVLIPLLFVNSEAFLMVPIITGLIIAVLYMMVVDFVWLNIIFVWPRAGEQHIEQPFFIDSIWKGVFIAIIPPIFTNFVLISYFALNKNIKTWLMTLPFYIPLVTQMFRYSFSVGYDALHFQHFVLGAAMALYYLCSVGRIVVDFHVYILFYIACCASFIVFPLVSLEAMSGFILCLLIFNYFRV